MAKDTTAVQLEIFDDVGWPPHERFPYNNRFYRVKDQVETDLFSARSPLLITGYASLDTLLDFFARCSSSQAQANPIRILLGHEPFIRESQSYTSSHIVLSEQIKHYWLEQGISLYHSIKIILAIEWLKSGRLQARIGGEQHPLHAKIYKGDTAITIGSSNFSYSGLIRQVEANVRFSASRAEVVRLFRGRCAISGANQLEGLEAAHIIPHTVASKEHKRSGLNGILLRADLHRLFDAGKLTIDPDTLLIELDADLQQASEYQRWHHATLVQQPDVVQLPLFQPHDLWRENLCWRQLYYRDFLDNGKLLL